MKRMMCIAGVAFVLLGSPAWSQPAAPLLLDPPTPLLAAGPDGAEDGQPLSPRPSLPTAPGPEGLSALEKGFFQSGKFDYNYLPLIGSTGLGINEFEACATFAVPLPGGLAPLLLTPDVAVHLWETPKPAVPGPPVLPSSLYDFQVEFGWKPRLAQWLFTDLAVAPGAHSDLDGTGPATFQVRGRGLAIVAFSPEWQVVLGGLYINRNKTKFLPAGGVIWNASEDTHCIFVFPQPKVSHRLTTIGQTQLWGYLLGDFGGGRWSVERTDGTHDSLDYTDLRLSLGLEGIARGGLASHFEVGYVFRRQVSFTSATPDFTPSDTVMLKAGVTY
jgi:hypothetical protein